MNSLGRSQVVRQWVLVPPSLGSNPSAPVIERASFNSLLFFILKTVGTWTFIKLQKTLICRGKPKAYWCQLNVKHLSRKELKSSHSQSETVLPSPAPSASLLPLLAFTRHFRVDRLLVVIGLAYQQQLNMYYTAHQNIAYQKLPALLIN